MAYKFNPITGKLDTVADPGGAAGQMQYFGADGAFAGASGAVIDSTTGRVLQQSFLASASTPTAPASAGFVLYAAPTSGALSWRGVNGFVRTLNASGITDDRTYQLQDKSGTIAHLDDIHDGYKVDNYIIPVPGGVGAGSPANVNTIYLTPFTVLRSIQISELGARVATALASSTFQLAIYGSASGLPTGNALGATADLSGATTTVLSASVTPFNLFAGRLYWMALNCSGSANTLAFQTANSSNTTNNVIVGAETLSTISSSAAGAAWNRTFSQTYGTWPSLTGQTTALATGARCPAIILKVAALL